MYRVRSNRALTTCRVFAAIAATLVGAATGQAQTVVLPGTTTVIDITTSAEDCFEDASVLTGVVQPVTECVSDAPASLPLQVLAASGISSDPNDFFGQTVLSVGKLIQEIQIPVPAGGAFSSSLPVQIATEVTWSGGMVVAGIDSTFAQVAGTFQVRDLTTGLVVASNTFLFERADADFEISVPESPSDFLAFLNLIEVVDVSNSSGADITVFLVRGRTYAIELEAKCDVQVPILGFGVCLYSSNALSVLGLPESDLFTAIDNDGFSATDITVTVGSDNVQDLF